jgi:HEAT repeat protein
MTRPLALTLAALLAAGCGGSQKKPTAAEWLRENTLILEQLRSYDRKERQQGINRFLRLGKEQGTEVVTYLLDDPNLEDYRIELVLARILAEWKDPRAIPYLARNLTGRDLGAMEIAKEGLIIFGEEPRILAAVGELLESPEARQRMAAAEVLLEMAGPDAPRLLGERLKVEEDREVRATCLLGVLQSRHRRRAEFLIEALADPEPEIRHMAWEGLVRLGPPARFQPEGDAAERRKAIEALRAWWAAGAPAAAQGGGARAGR